MADTAHKLYTRRGDQGETRVLNGETVAKDNIRVKVYGAVDEFQSNLGLARSLVSWGEMKSFIFSIQGDLFVAGAELASTPRALDRLKKRLGNEDVARIENWIDQLSTDYGLPNSFVTPGRDPASAALHVARAVCRRCERLIVTLSREAPEYGQLLIYFNRLGDLLFALSWAVELRVLVEQTVRELLSTSDQGEAPCGA